MKIQPPKDDLRFDSSTHDLLKLFIEQPEPRLAPPCSGCNRHEPTNCTAQCDRAAAALSIDPEQYPIEPKVVGLVFEITASRLLQTCYSCEGHSREGELWKLPQVCFYSDSPIYAKLVMIHLDRLFLKKTLSYRWHIVLADLTQTLNLTYSIQPDLNREQDHHLGKLQQDLNTLSTDMHTALKEIAAELLASTNAA
ncbi:MAG: hypothetical protein JKY89_07830 [Immundisolibacteraceae bacterium]|nr:hypothetical protein [Immundisolibacteraceae bacterium]